MTELYNDMDDKSRDAAQNIRIAFDESAWDKMESLLNDEAMKPDAPTVSNPVAVNTDNRKNRRWGSLVVLFLLTGATLVFTKNYFTPENGTLSLAKNDPKALNKSTHENVIDSHERRQFTDKHLLARQSEDNTNKNFKSQATFDNNTTLSPITKFKNVSSKKIKIIAKEDNLFRVDNDVQKNRDNDLRLNKQNESKAKVEVENKQSDLEEISIGNLKTIDLAPHKKFIEEGNDTNQHQLTILPGVNKKHEPSSKLKNKFFKNIGFSAFVFPEMSSVRFKASDKITLGYGVGINYTIGKHFTLQTQFSKARKLYVTDRKGYNPVAGSSLIPIDTLKVNADCKVWDIPVNLRYNFKSNIKNDFFISAGISSYIMKKEIYDFAYYDQGIYEKKQRIIENENKHSFCNLNLSVGYQYWLNKKWSIGFEPYFKLPLNGVGAGKVKLTSAGVLFNLTFKPLK